MKDDSPYLEPRNGLSMSTLWNVRVKSEKYKKEVSGNPSVYVSVLLLKNQANRKQTLLSIVNVDIRNVIMM